MSEGDPSETLVAIYETAQCCNPEGRNLDCCENQKCHLPQTAIG
jgi:hypothetical protein